MTMNIDRLTEIAEWLEAGAPEKHGVAEFNMSEYIGTPRKNTCGTACCIAGSAIQFSRAEPYESESKAMNATDMPGGYLENAQIILGLAEDQAFDLFYAEGSNEELGDIGPAWAARVIRNLISTGEVDWLGTKLPD